MIVETYLIEVVIRRSRSWKDSYHRMPYVLAISNLLIICEQVLVSSFRQNTHRKTHLKGWGSLTVETVTHKEFGKEPVEVYAINLNHEKMRIIRGT